MTCIVGLVCNDNVFMGGDSQGSGGGGKVALKNRKVFKNGAFLIGYTSSYRMGQLLQHSFSPPAQKEGQDVFAYMTTDFINAVRDCMKSGGYSTNDKGEESGGDFLVGYKGRLFEIQDDYAVLESEHTFNSVGCGFAYAFGSLYSTDNLDPRERILKALGASEQFSMGVGKPYYVETLDTTL